MFLALRRACLINGVVAMINKILAGALLCCASAGSYAGTIYSTEASFLASAGTTTTEDFESYPTGSTGSGAVANYTFDDFSVSSDPAAIKVLGSSAYGNHNTTSGGSKYLSFDTDIGSVGSDIIFEFDFGFSPLNAFGLYFTDTDHAVEVVIDGVSYDVSATGDGGENYFGFVSDVSFSSIMINGGSTDSHWSVDDVSYAVASVPEPGSVFLLVAALSGLAVRYRGKSA